MAKNIKLPCHLIRRQDSNGRFIYYLYLRQNGSDWHKLKEDPLTRELFNEQNLIVGNNLSDLLEKAKITNFQDLA